MFGAREVVEEDPADPARLAAVGDEEVVVAPLLEGEVDIFAVRVARGLDRLVEVRCVVIVQVRGREVRAAPEPPCVDLARRPRRLLRTLWLPVLLFTAWDLVAIARDHWDFEDRYVTGWTLPGGLPFEELTFFVVIPLCGLLSFEASRRTLGK